MSSALPCGMPSTTSNSTISPNSLRPARRASVPPIWPAPISAILLRAICVSSGCGRDWPRVLARFAERGNAEAGGNKFEPLTKLLRPGSLPEPLTSWLRNGRERRSIAALVDQVLDLQPPERDPFAALNDALDGPAGGFPIKPGLSRDEPRDRLAVAGEDELLAALDRVEERAELVSSL